MPALPLDTAGRYVAAAYLVFMLILIIYVAIMASRLTRIQKDITVIDEMLKARDEHAAKAPPLPTEASAQQ